jgi:hypothetical protein
MIKASVQKTHLDRIPDLRDIKIAPHPPVQL